MGEPIASKTDLGSHPREMALRPAKQTYCHRGRQSPNLTPLPVNSALDPSHGIANTVGDGSTAPKMRMG
jgi:hypothetical protein